MGLTDLTNNVHCSGVFTAVTIVGVILLALLRMPGILNETTETTPSLPATQEVQLTQLELLSKLEPSLVICMLIRFRIYVTTLHNQKNASIDRGIHVYRNRALVLVWDLPYLHRIHEENSIEHEKYRRFKCNYSRTGTGNR